MNPIHPSPVPIRPFPLPPTYTWRSYLGGSRLRGFRRQEPGTDDHFPEDWLASTTHARNGVNRQGPHEGISRVDMNGRLVPIPDALSRWPDLFWGPTASPRPDIGVLIKLLDSSTRLHIQAHPDASFVQRHFGGTAGKTECWYILGTRGEGYVYLGFQHAPSPPEWKRLIEDQDIDGMLGCFEKIPVKPGDCYVVPAGTPHAIGEGVLMIELQEPTDWVVRCEFEVGGHRLPHDARYMGLELQDCMEIFDFTEFSLMDVRSRFCQVPQILHQTNTATEETIIDDAWRGVFRLRRVTGSGQADWEGNELMVLIATEGAGILSCESEERQPIGAGETWLLPGAAGRWRWEATSSAWQVLLAQPPG